MMQTGRANVLPQGELLVPHYAQQGSVQPWGAKYGKRAGGRAEGHQAFQLEGYLVVCALPMTFPCCWPRSEAL